MPGTPRPIVDPVLGVVWGSIKQAAQNQKQATSNLASQQQQGATYDRYGNVTSLMGTNLAQQVQIGGTWLATAASPSVPAGLNAGVFVMGPTGSGICTPSGIAIGTVTLSSLSSYDATISPISGSFEEGDQIGAYVLNSNGTTSTAIVPGTTIASISGSAIVLSEYPVLTGTGLYCAACTFSIVS